MGSVFKDTLMSDSENLISLGGAGDSPLLANGMLVEANPDLIEPFINGYNYITFSKLPDFFNDNIKANYRAYTERNIKGIDVFQDFELETASITHGFNGQTYDVASNLKRDINRITLTHNEFWNLPVSRLGEAWVTGIRDPETGMAHYHGDILKENIQYKPSYHTGAMFTWVTDPAGKGLLRAAVLVNMFPLPVKLSQFNFSSGDHSTQDMSINYSCIYHESKYINAVCRKLNELSVANKQHSNAWGSSVYSAVQSGNAGKGEMDFMFDKDWTENNSITSLSDGQFDDKDNLASGQSPSASELEI